MRRRYANSQDRIWTTLDEVMRQGLTDEQYSQRDVESTM